MADNTGILTGTGASRSSVPIARTAAALLPEPIPDPVQIITDNVSLGDDDQRTGGVIMAVDLNDRGSLGCAYLMTDESQLFLLGGATNSDVGDVERLIIMIRPTTILSSARACDGLTQYLEAETQRALSGMYYFRSFLSTLMSIRSVGSRD
jgi:hypothetical protein